MAIIKASKGGKTLSKAIHYAAKDEIVSGINCPDDPKLACQQMQSTKKMWEKEGGRIYKPYVQSFVKDETTPEQAHEIGRKFAEENFPGFEVIVGTHTDSKSGCFHNHFVVNSVSFEDGHKIHTSKQDLERFKEVSDRLCREHGLSVIDRTQEREPGTVKAWDRDKYQVLKKGMEKPGVSYVCDTVRAIEKAFADCEGKGYQAFEQSMNGQGYSVEWRGNKHVIFANLETGKEKIRGTKLADTFSDLRYTREGIHNIIARQKEIPNQIKTVDQPIKLPKMKSLDEISKQTSNIQKSVRVIGKPDQRHSCVQGISSPSKSQSQGKSIGGGGASHGDGKPDYDDLIAQGFSPEKAQEIIDQQESFKMQLNGCGTDSIMKDLIKTSRDMGFSR